MARCRVAQAEYLRVPQAQFTHIKVPDGRPVTHAGSRDLSDVSADSVGQSVQYADVPDGGLGSPCWGWGRSATWPRGSRNV